MSGRGFCSSGHLGLEPLDQRDVEQGSGKSSPLLVGNPSLFPKLSQSLLEQDELELSSGLVPAHAWVSPGGRSNWSTRPFWQFWSSSQAELYPAVLRPGRAMVLLSQNLQETPSLAPTP